MGQITIGKAHPRLILKDRGCGDEIGQNLHQHLKVSPTYFVSNIRRQHRCSQILESKNIGTVMRLSGSFLGKVHGSLILLWIRKLTYLIQKLVSKTDHNHRRVHFVLVLLISLNLERLQVKSKNSKNSFSPKNFLILYKSKQTFFILYLFDWINHSLDQPKIDLTK